MNTDMHHYTFRNGGTNSQMTEATAYAEGYESGATWDKFAPYNKYVPGGPHISRPDVGRHFYNPDPEWVRYCEQSERNHEAWMRGWHDGRKGVEANPLPMHNVCLGYN